MGMMFAMPPQGVGMLMARPPQAPGMQQFGLMALQPPQPVLAAQQPRQQKPAAVQVRAAPAPAQPAPQQPEDREETAARQLKIARVALADADTAEEKGDKDRATRMRDRAGTRLRDIAARYPETAAAGEAKDLVDKLGL
jgi:hypothetical protein